MGNPKETLGQSQGQGQHSSPEVKLSGETLHVGLPARPQGQGLDLGSGKITLDPLIPLTTIHVETPVKTSNQSQGQGQSSGSEVEISVDTVHVDLPTRP